MTYYNFNKKNHYMNKYFKNKKKFNKNFKNFYINNKD